MCGDHRDLHGMTLPFPIRRSSDLELDVAMLERQTFLIHTELPASFEAWKDALGIRDLEPAAIDHYDSGQLMLEAAKQGLGIAIMHDDHLRRAADSRLTELYGVEVERPRSEEHTSELQSLMRTSYTGF